MAQVRLTRFKKYQTVYVWDRIWYRHILIDEQWKYIDDINIFRRPGGLSEVAEEYKPFDAFSLKYPLVYEALML